MVISLDLLLLRIVFVLAIICSRVLRLLHFTFYTGNARREFVSQDSSHSQGKRWCCHFLYNNCLKQDQPGLQWTQENEAAGTGSFWSPSPQGNKAVLQPFVHRSVQERVGLPQVLTQAYRHKRGKSSRQRQQEHLTAEITRWHKANTRNLPIETKSTWQYHNPVVLSQQVVDVSIHQKSNIQI